MENIYYKYGDIVKVFLPLKLDKLYSYGVGNLQIQMGDVVVVNLRNQEYHGVVLGQIHEIDFDIIKLKNIVAKVDNIPALNKELINFISWLSNYTLSNIGAVLKQVLNISGFNFSETETYLSLNITQLKHIKITKPRGIIIDMLAKIDAIEKSELIALSGVSGSVVNNLIKQDVLQVENKIKVSNFQHDIAYKPVALNQEQIDVSKALKGYLSQQNSISFKVALLKGLPGSGKTEVFFDVMHEIINMGKQVLIMLPEIALSTQIVDRFYKRFGVQPYVWHSGISKKEKKDTWSSALNGSLKVIIGARSSLFLPFNNLGLIVVDEEHDSSYKQEEGVVYNARDMAIVRCKIHNVPIILSSATPSIETSYNVRQGKYSIFELNNRYNAMIMPKIEIIDMSKEKLGRNEYISASLHNKIQGRLAKSEQTLLFVNKRGYSNCMFCKNCLEKLLCVNCSVSLVEHKSKNVLMCHYCGYQIKNTLNCMYCNSENSLISIGVGVERVFEEVSSKYPEARVVILSSDTMNSHKKSLEILADVHNNKYDILIGTQIISKGHHFENLTLVGIVDGDFNYGLDMKSNEKTWQMLYQVAGRSGRGEIEGEVCLQSYSTDNIILKTLVNYNYEGFISEEINLRESAKFPPYSKMVGIVIYGENKQVLNDYCEFIANNIDNVDKNIEILGAIDAPIGYLRKNYRKRFLIKSTVEIKIQDIIKKYFLNYELPRGLKMTIDVDPISFY